MDRKCLETKRKLEHVLLYCDPHYSLGTRRNDSVFCQISIMESFDALLKVVMIGDTSVGKTCLLLRYTQDIFRANFLSTIGECGRRTIVNYAGLEHRV